MVIFGITRHNCIGKYDEFHCNLDNAEERFMAISCAMPAGDRLLLMEIHLGARKKVRMIREFCK